MCRQPTTQGPAATGQLIFLAAGDEQVFKAATTELDAMGKVRLEAPERANATRR